MTTLESLQNTKATKDGVTMADPYKMFNRLITIASREHDLEPMFGYELTFEPMSLFKDGLMRKPDTECDHARRRRCQEKLNQRLQRVRIGWRSFIA